jgi:hypothetical protein
LEYRHIIHHGGTVGFWERYRGVVVINYTKKHFVFAADFYVVYDQAQEQTLCVEVCGSEGSGKVDGDVGEDVWRDFWDGFDGGGIEF